MPLLSSTPSPNAVTAAQKINELVAAVEQVVLGKRGQIRLAVACLLCRGHLLIEDLPGMGKTTLARALAATLGLQFKRIQFTSDLLPADILGASVFNSVSRSFEFQPGPVFSQLLLADEINRATAKAQSALLEAMEERQVSVEGEALALPEPFFVLATQNPVTQTGTFPLPESQLDRFLMRLELGYPDHAAERAMLQGEDPRRRIALIEPVLTLAELEVLQAQVERVRVSDHLLDYLQRLLDYSRQASDFNYGISPRGAQALKGAAQAWALMEGRDYVVPDDLQQVLPAVVEHRLRGGIGHAGHQGTALARQLLDAVDVTG